MESKIFTQMEEENNEMPGEEEAIISDPTGCSHAKADGYRGIWYSLGQFSEYGDKYSGGLATYTANHVPVAIYVREVEKTFFVYGGSRHGERYLLAMAGYYDHRRGVVPRPTIVHDCEGVDDPHDNPSLAVDGDGHVWVFVSGRADRRPGRIYRSRRPYCIDAFESVYQGEFAYPQPWWVEGEGFIHLFTRYTEVDRSRELYFARSEDGRHWREPVKLAGIEGHYQVSNRIGRRVVSAFVMLPGADADRRTNLYFVETSDMGKTWSTVDGRSLVLPLDEASGPALVRDYRARGRMVYISDVRVDAEGRPVILFVTTASSKPGPEGAPRRQNVAFWDGGQWQFRVVTETTHNYDVGSIHIEEDTWRVFVPSQPGPQYWGAGGEVVIWRSEDRGNTWRRERAITSGSPRNHSYVRRPIDANADFYAFWADGDADSFSPSQLYFTDKAGSQVWRLPELMMSEFARPEVFQPKAPNPGKGLMRTESE